MRERKTDGESEKKARRKRKRKNKNLRNSTFILQIKNIDILHYITLITLYITLLLVSERVKTHKGNTSDALQIHYTV